MKKDFFFIDSGFLDDKNGNMMVALATERFTKGLYLRPGVEGKVYFFRRWNFFGRLTLVEN
jgi:hypothetical protein